MYIFVTKRPYSTYSLNGTSQMVVNDAIWCVVILNIFLEFFKKGIANRKMDAMNLSWRPLCVSL